MITVFLIDDNVKVRRLLAAHLGRQGGIQVLGEAAPGEEAVQQVVELQPSVVLLETKTGDSRGLDTCRRLHRAAPGLPVLVLTSYLDEDERSQTRMAGASAYLLKDLGSAELTEKIRKASDNPGQSKQTLTPESQPNTSEEDQ